MLQFLAPLYLGWSLGANDGANLLGTAVSTKMVRFVTAASLAAVFVLAGAVIEGHRGMATLSALSGFDVRSATSSSLGAALTVTVLTLLRVPVSTSQAVVGAILGVGLLRGGADPAPLNRIVLCWLGTPLGAGLVAMVLYVVLGPWFNRLAARLIAYDLVLRGGLVVAGCYSAYALGANNVANVTGVYVGAGVVSPTMGSILGGLAIGFGILTFSRGVMVTVGRGIIRLNAYSALIVVLAQAVTVHAYAIVGVPVSSSQAVVGAVIGIGLLKSAETFRLRAVVGIFSGWLATPLIAMACSAALHVIAHMRFVP